MSKQKKEKLTPRTIAVRVLCIVFAFLMIAGALSTIIICLR